MPSMSGRSRTRFASAGRCRVAVRARGCLTPSSFLALPAELVTLWSRAGSQVVPCRVRDRQLCVLVNWAPGACVRACGEALVSCPQSQWRGSLANGTWGASRPLPVSSCGHSRPCSRQPSALPRAAGLAALFMTCYPHPSQSASVSSVPLYVDPVRPADV